MLQCSLDSSLHWASANGACMFCSAIETPAGPVMHVQPCLQAKVFQCISRILAWNRTRFFGHLCLYTQKVYVYVVAGMGLVRQA